MRLEFMGRSYRGFTFIPKLWPGVNGCRTSLLQWLWWAWVVVPEYIPED